MASNLQGLSKTPARLGWLPRFVSCIAVAGVSVVGTHAEAAENAANVYLLGSGGPGAAVMPPFEGVIFDNTFYLYDGNTSSEQEFVFGGRVVAGPEVTVPIDMATILWVPTTNFAGGTLALGLVLPIGGPSVDVSAVLTGPGGAQISQSRKDSIFTLGDPVAMAMLGWKSGNLHVQASTLVNIPIGDYNEGALANLAFHRWAGDVSLAASLHDPNAGWDMSAKFGVTFNGTNDRTDYNTGNEFHAEAAAEKSFSPAFSAGFVGYYYDQFTGDSGAGAVLGPFEGKTMALGATAAFNFKMGRIPATLRIKVFEEIDVENRLKGNAGFLSLTFPLSVKMPAGAPPPGQ